MTINAKQELTTYDNDSVIFLKLATCFDTVVQADFSDYKRIIFASNELRAEPVVLKIIRITDLTLFGLSCLAILHLFLALIISCNFNSVKLLLNYCSLNRMAPSLRKNLNYIELPELFQKNRSQTIQHLSSAHQEKLTPALPYLDHDDISLTESLSIAKSEDFQEPT